LRTFADRNIQTLSVFVPGKAVAQGSKRYVGNGISVESSKALRPWRADVKLMAYYAMEDQALQQFNEAVSVRLLFVLPRPVATSKKRTPDAVKRPDIDKLSRAVLDAFKDVVWHDDSQVVDLHATKRLAEPDERAGVHVTVTSNVVRYNRRQPR
jgi:crossover junction endodeoxyribonuclease RusA